MEQDQEIKEKEQIYYLKRWKYHKFVNMDVWSIIKSSLKISLWIKRQVIWLRLKKIAVE